MFCNDRFDSGVPGTVVLSFGTELVELGVSDGTFGIHDDLIVKFAITGGIDEQFNRVVFPDIRMKLEKCYKDIIPEMEGFSYETD